MSASKRKQPTRSVRTSTTRPSNYYAKPFGWARGGGGGPAQEEEQPQETQHGFFPAITHFTDAIAALPKEVMRQMTLLKETEGKAYPPEEAMGEIIGRINQLPQPPIPQSQSLEQAYFGFSVTNSLNGSAPASVMGDSAPGTLTTQSDTGETASSNDPYLSHRRAWFYQLRYAMNEMIGALDEKNGMLTSANETLTRQLSRLEGTLPYVEEEISEEARLGSNTHWALAHMREARKASGQTNDRHRRDVGATNNLAAAAAAVHETDVAAVRSEARREAMGQKRRHNVDSDFDERHPNKRSHAGKTAKRPQQGADPSNARGAAKDQPNKKRRVEKGSQYQNERAPPAPAGGRVQAGREGLTGFREAPQEARKRAKPLPTAVSTKKKYAESKRSDGQIALLINVRNATNAPSVASSPTRGTFATTTTSRRDYSPAAPQGSTQRARQNSGLSVRSNAMDNGPRIPGPMSVGAGVAMPNGNHVGTPELRNVATATGKSINEARSDMKDIYTSTTGGQMVEQDGMHGALLVDGAGADQSGPLKREETEPADDMRARGFIHKPSIPAESVEGPEPMARTRSNRGNGTHRGSRAEKEAGSATPEVIKGPPRRVHRNPYHKQYDGHLAMQETDVDEEEGEHTDGEGASSDEPRYCFCNQTSHGFMVACDNDSCPHEWFHLECVGLTEAPPDHTKWYCEECNRNLKRGGSGVRNGGK